MSSLERRHVHGNDCADVAARSLVRPRKLPHEGPSDAVLVPVLLFMVRCYRHLLECARKRDEQQPDRPLDSWGQDFVQHFVLERSSFPQPLARHPAATADGKAFDRFLWWASRLAWADEPVAEDPGVSFAELAISFFVCFACGVMPRRSRRIQQQQKIINNKMPKGG